MHGLEACRHWICLYAWLYARFGYAWLCKWCKWCIQACIKALLMQVHWLYAFWRLGGLEAWRQCTAWLGGLAMFCMLCKWCIGYMHGLEALAMLVGNAFKQVLGL